MIRLMKSTFYNEKEVKEKLCDFIKNTEILSMNKKCKEFEEQFSIHQKRKYSVCFNSGSSANLALIQTLINLGSIKKGDLVGFSALTWATNVMPLLQLGLNPVPIDVSLENLNVNSTNLLQTLEKTELRAIFITNLLGFCADLDKIKEICAAKNILLIEDNCESLGSELKNTKLGNFGLASTFSSFVGHHLSTIEGGMVCTDNKEVYEMLLMVRAHGWDRNLDKETQEKLRTKYNINEFYARYSFYYDSYNLRPTEITGFIGVEQLKFIDQLNKIREENFKLFSAASNLNPNFQTFKLDKMNLVSNFAYPLICNDQESFQKYQKKFSDKGIETRPIVGGSIVEQPFFIKYLKENNLTFDCPNARRIHSFGFYFPNNPELTTEERELICSLLKNE